MECCNEKSNITCKNDGNLGYLIILILYILLAIILGTFIFC